MEDGGLIGAIERFLAGQAEKPLSIENRVKRLFPVRNFGILPALENGELKVVNGGIRISHPRSFPNNLEGEPLPYFQAGDCVAVIANILNEDGASYTVHRESLEFELPEEKLIERWQHYFIRLASGDELDPTPFGERRTNREQPKPVPESSAQNRWKSNQQFVEIEHLVPLQWIPLNELETIFIRGGIYPGSIPQAFSGRSNLPPEAISFEVLISKMRLQFGGWKPEDSSIARIRIPLGIMGQIQNQVKELGLENFLNSSALLSRSINLHLDALNDERFAPIDRQAIRNIFYLLISKVPVDELGLWRPRPMNL